MFIFYESAISIYSKFFSEIWRVTTAALWRGAGQGKLRLRFSEQIVKAPARFGRVTIEFQKLPIMLDVETDDVCIFRH